MVTRPSWSLKHCNTASKLAIDQLANQIPAPAGSTILSNTNKASRKNKTFSPSSSFDVHLLCMLSESVLVKSVFVFVKFSVGSYTSPTCFPLVQNASMPVAASNQKPEVRSQSPCSGWSYVTDVKAEPMYLDFPVRPPLGALTVLFMTQNSPEQESDGPDGPDQISSQRIPSQPDQPNL